MHTKTAFLIGFCMILLCLLSSSATAEQRIESFSAKDMDIRDVLEMLSVQYQLNIVASQDVEGFVTVSLYDLSLDEALEAILGANGYVFQRQGRVIYVFLPPEMPPMQQHVFGFKWVTADEMIIVLSEFSTEDGRIVKAQTEDAVVVNDTAEVIDQMSQIVQRLDRQPKQVMIEAQMIEVGETSLKKIGFNWANLADLKVLELTAETDYSRVSDHTDDGSTVTKEWGSNVSVRAGILDENSFNVLASFFSDLTDSHIVSQPRILTLDAKKASILVGTIVPIPLYDYASDTGVRTLSGFQMEQIGAAIDVIPHVREDDFILLEVIPTVEQIIDYIRVDGDRQRPVKSTRRAETQVMIKDGHTMVIGGLRGQTRIGSEGQVPYLHRIPLLGGLFRNSTNDLQYTELIIFITPRVVTQSNVTEREEEIRTESDKIDLQPLWRHDEKP